MSMPFTGAVQLSAAAGMAGGCGISIQRSAAAAKDVALSVTTAPTMIFRNNDMDDLPTFVARLGPAESSSQSSVASECF
jgi:hypothetical protein